MTLEKAKKIIKSECYIADLLNLDRTRMVNTALDTVIKAAEQQPKIGRWIDGKCNRCGTHAPFWAMSSGYYCSEYCPNCGAKMAEGSDEECR